MALHSTLGLPAPRRDPLSRAVGRFAATGPGSALFARLMPALDRTVSRASRGRLTATELAAGLPTVYLTTRGARTGLDRTVPLVAVPFEGDVVVVGSNWGGAKHPGWVHNLIADPAGRLRYRDREVPVAARELDGERAEQAWAVARALYHGYRLYPERTGGRAIRLFVLILPPGSRPPELLARQDRSTAFTG